MKTYSNIDEVWQDLNQGRKVYWNHTGYEIVREPVTKGIEFQEKHFSRQGNEVLCIRYTENWFGGIIDETEVKELFSEVTK